ncbi:cation:proton antiporter [Rhizobium sp. RU36D]|uniref:cation:proton antiporter n=1 Tax=Rhizobium sp. RU36D TaxID=1907415 RepID=UPI0009D7E238|nr:cation:proton antiporter [Rhizobium sp. RU36D]SMC96881.1 multicomponent Na+:H+ antiporter subunit F [Rhizobium sp. RU36D]
MTAADTVVLAACNFALVVLGVSFFLTVYRVVKGPTLPDRVLALDMLVGIAIGFIAVIAIRTGYTLYIDIAIALGLVGFLATIAFARFILSRGRVDEQDEEKAPPATSAAKASPSAKKPGKAAASGKSPRAPGGAVKGGR